MADRRLTPIEDVKVSLRSIRTGLDDRFPRWKAAYDASRDYLTHDARREYFVALQTILQNAQLGFVFIHDQLTDEKWWIQRVGEYREAMALQALREHALMIKFFSFHAIAVATEETCRAIVRADEDVFKATSTAPFQTIYLRLLKLTKGQTYEPLFELLRLTRNTIHTNGVHRPSNGKNITIAYSERTFDFEVGKILGWMGDDFPDWLARELGQAMQHVVESEVVGTLAACPRSN